MFQNQFGSENIDMIQVTGIVYERKKSYFAGLFAFISTIAVLISILYLTSSDQTLQAQKPKSDSIWLVVVIGILAIILIINAIYSFFSNLKFEFVKSDGKMAINFYKGERIIRSFNVDKLDFSIVAANSNYSRYASRLLLEMRVESKTGCFSLTEDSDENKPGIKIETECGFYLEHYFCRTPGTLNELYNKLKMENASTSI